MLTDTSGERKRTNVGAIYFCIAFVVVLFAFFGYSFATGSVYRIINGIDDCGNICGKQNGDNSLNYCGPHDKSSLKFTLVNITKDAENPNITITHSQCVNKCEDFTGYVTVVNRCFLSGNGTDGVDDAAFSSFLQKVAEDLSNSWLTIVVSCLVALVFSYILLMLFRYAIKYVVWVIYIGLIVALALGAVAFLILFFVFNSSDEEDKAKPYGFLILAAVLAIFALVLGVVIYFFRKRIRLVIQLFKEASKALVDVPSLTFEPLLTFLALALTCVTSSYFQIVIVSSGRLTVQKDKDGNFDKAEYEPDVGNQMAHYANLVAFIWFTSFVIGCQHFVIAGTVSQWFFTRNKSKLDSPMKRSFNYLLRFHLGSVCLGSILITIIKIIRMIVENGKSSMRNSESPFARAVVCCCDFIMVQLEQLLQYLVRNAYIIVAMDGTPLIASGKKAFNLLAKNLIDVIALNQVGDFILFLGRIFVVLIVGFVSYELAQRNDAIQLKFIPVVLSIIFAFLIVHCFLTVYEMTIDTIFICFCEDCEQNDGINRPYFMSRGMMEVMQELKNAAGGEFNFGGQNIEAGARPMIPPSHQFSN